MARPPSPNRTSPPLSTISRNMKGILKEGDSFRHSRGRTVYGWIYVSVRQLRTHTNVYMIGEGAESR